MNTSSSSSLNMNHNEATTQLAATEVTTDAIPLHNLTPARVYMGLSRSIRRPINFVTESLSPTQIESDLEAALPKTTDPEKPQTECTTRQSTDSALSGPTQDKMPPKPMSLLNMPPELQMVLLQYLNFNDIQNLRRTCRYWHYFATPRLVRNVWGHEMFRFELIRYCRVCMAYRPVGLSRLFTSPQDPGYPLSSRCLECTVQARDGTLRVGRKTKLGNYLEYWTCRWCGWPVTCDSSATHSQFHHRCFRKYSLGMLVFFLLGWTQLFIGIVASVLCWRYFRGDMLVLAPTVVGFLFMFFCVLFLGMRGNKVRTYHWSLVLELIIAGLWVGSTFSISIFRFSFCFPFCGTAPRILSYLQEVQYVISFG